MHAKNGSISKARLFIIQQNNYNKIYLRFAFFNKQNQHYISAKKKIKKIK